VLGLLPNSELDPELRAAKEIKFSIENFNHLDGPVIIPFSLSHGLGDHFFHYPIHLC
jgi:hypothetical protein